MSNLKEQLIRLGHKNLSLRKHLRPILAHVKNSSEEASELHEERLRAIEVEIAELSKKIQQRKNRRDVNWGEVGDLGHVLDVLQDLNKTFRS